jgi:hypothetical protein
MDATLARGRTCQGKPLDRHEFGAGIRKYADRGYAEVIAYGERLVAASSDHAGGSR